MTRIATAILIVAAVLVFNGGMLRDAFAEDQGMRVRLEATAKAEGCPVVEARASRLMSLIVCLEALRQAPALTVSPKV